MFFIGLISFADPENFQRGGGQKDNSVQTPHDPPLDPCMDYTVIKNVKWEKGERTHPDSVWNDTTNLTGVLNESYYKFGNWYTDSFYFQFAKDNNLLFYETSAKESANLEKVYS